MPITTKNELQGGQQTSPNRAPAARVIASGLASQRVANALIAALGGVASSVVIAAHTSTTTDWASLQVGDILVHIPATAGNTSFETVAAAGTKPSASKPLITSYVGICTYFSLVFSALSAAKIDGARRCKVIKSKL